jgi:Helix-turn-helix domain
VAALRPLFNPWHLFVGSFLPNWLLDRRELTPGAKLCYARLCQFAGRHGVAYPTQLELAAALGVTDRQVRKYLRELTSVRVDGRPAPLISVGRRGLRRANTFVFHRHPWMGVDNFDLNAAERAIHAENLGRSVPKNVRNRNYSSGQDRNYSSGPIGRDSITSTSRRAAAPRTGGPSALRSRKLGEVLSNLSAALSMPGTQLPGVRDVALESVRARLATLDEGTRKDLNIFARWLAQTGCSEEAVQVIVADFLSRPDVENPYAYYAKGSEARFRLIPR